jgi:hypothetical protein
MQLKRDSPGMNLVALLMADPTPRSPLAALYAPLRAFPAVGKGRGKAQSLQAILAPLKACHAPLPHRPITMPGSLHRMSTYNTNRRQDTSKDRKEDKPEHKVKGRVQGQRKAGEGVVHRYYAQVLC